MASCTSSASKHATPTARPQGAEVGRLCENTRLIPRAGTVTRSPSLCLDTWNFPLRISSTRQLCPTLIETGPRSLCWAPFHLSVGDRACVQKQPVAPDRETMERQRVKVPVRCCCAKPSLLPLLRASTGLQSLEIIVCSVQEEQKRANIERAEKERLDALERRSFLLLSAIVR